MKLVLIQHILQEMGGGGTPHEITGHVWFFHSVSQISVVGDPVLNVNCLHVQSFDAELYRQLICYPQVMSPIL